MTSSLLLMSNNPVLTLARSNRKRFWEPQKPLQTWNWNIKCAEWNFPTTVTDWLKTDLKTCLLIFFCSVLIFLYYCTTKSFRIFVNCLLRHYLLSGFSISILLNIHKKHEQNIFSWFSALNVYHTTKKINSLSKFFACLYFSVMSIKIDAKQNLMQNSQTLFETLIFFKISIKNGLKHFQHKKFTGI